MGDNIKMYLQEVDRTDVAQNKDRCQNLVNAVLKLRVS